MQAATVSRTLPTQLLFFPVSCGGASAGGGPVLIIKIQSPSSGVGNWQVSVVTTATAGLVSPLRGLNQLMFGDGGRELSLISMVRSSGTYTIIKSFLSVRAAETNLAAAFLPGLFTTNTGVGRNRQKSLVEKNPERWTICSAPGMVSAFFHGMGVPVPAWSVGGFVPSSQPHTPCPP